MPMILLFSALAAAGLLQGPSAAAAPGSAGFWILVCEMPAPAAREPVDGQRTFRLGPQSFQEWKPDRVDFGSNLCLKFPCAAEEGRLQGTISSATLNLTIS